MAGAIQAPVAEETEFPTLGAAASVRESKKEKKKKQTMSLSEFVGGSSNRRKPDDDSIVFSLPTAPRGRVEGEESTDRPLGGAFNKGFGGDRYGGRGGDERPRRGGEEDAGPSRADMAGDWGAERKFVPTSGGGDRYGDREGGGFRDRGGFGSGRGFDRDRDDRPPRRDIDEGPSRADMADDWGTSRQFAPSEAPRRGGFEEGPSGFRERGSFAREPSKAETEERWERHGEHKPIGFDDRPRRGLDDLPFSGSRRGFSEGWRGRDGEATSSVDSREASQDRWRREAPLSSPRDGDDEAPRERPRLNLKPRTTPTEQAPGSLNGNAAAARPSIFGAARPREDVLKEQGKDPLVEEERVRERALPGKKGPPAQVDVVKAKIAEEESRLAEAASEEDKAAAEEAIATLQAELAELQVQASGGEGQRERRRENREANNRANGRNSSFKSSSRPGSATGSQRRPKDNGMPRAEGRDAGNRW